MNGFIHRIPFFRLFLAVAAGIWAGSVLKIPVLILIVIGLLSVAGMATPFFIKHSTLQFRFRWLFGAGALSFLFIFGLCLFQYQHRQVVFPFDGRKGVYLVRIQEAPIEKAKSTLYKVRIMQYVEGNKSLSINKTALLYCPKDSSRNRFGFGDNLLVYTTFSKPKISGNPEEFDFGRYLEFHGISATGYAAKGTFKKIGNGATFSLTELSSRLRMKLLGVYRKYRIEGDEFAVVAALMLGYNDALTRELMDSYSVTGAMHVLSVSGLHVAIICAVFYFLLGFMDKKRSLFIAKHLIVIVLLWGFAFLTGLAPAVVRSALMFSLIAFGYVVSRKPQIYNTIFFSAFVMLLYNPDYLFDVGFQLSYLAVLSIVYFEPKFKRLIHLKNRPLRWIWELTCVSVAAQIGTAALGVFYFHRFANFFWLSNMVVVPLSGFIMYAAMALLLAAPFPVIANWIAFMLKWLLVGMNGAIRWIEHLPLAAYNMWLDSWQLFVVSVAIACAVAYFSLKRYAFLWMSLLCAALFLADDVGRMYNASRAKEVIVWADSKNTHVQFVDGTRSFAVSSDSLQFHRLSSAYRIRNRIGNEKFYGKAAVAFLGKHYLITNDTLFRRKYSDRRIPVDYLIIGNKTRITMDKLLRFVLPEQVIIDHTISSWYSKRIKAECDSLHIACVDTKVSGAFRLKIN